MAVFLPDNSQKMVMDCRSTACIMAGAGSGKTGTLVASLVSRLDEARALDTSGGRSLDILDILALTFTEKAAAELRHRLGLAFRERQFAAETAAATEEAIFWRGQASRLDRADIGTIHSYALKLVRENALTLGLTASPLIDTDDRIMADDLREITIDWLDHGDRDYLDLLEYYSSTALKEILLICVNRASSWGLGNFTSLPVTPPDVDWPERLAGFRLLAAEALDFVHNGDLNPEKDYYWTIKSSVEKLVRLLEADDRNIMADLALALEIINGSGRWPTKKSNELKKILKGEAQALITLANETISVERQSKLLRLIRRLRDGLAARKKSRGSINFDDILILARRLLASHPEIRQREIAKRRVVLIDEFQDTNRLQASLLAYLLLSPDDRHIYMEDHDPWGNLNWADIAPKFTVFGDLKQSIYRFRGAEVDIMGGLKEALTINGRVLALDSNYRSQASLVQFFNTLFVKHLKHFDERDNQTEVRPDLYGGPHIVRLSTAGRPPAGPEKPHLSAGLLVNYLNDIFTGKRNILVADGHGQSRLPQPGDVAVLFRRKRHMAVFRDALQSAGWRCRQPAGENIFQYEEVRGLLGAYLYLNGVDQEVSLAAMLRSPLGPVSDETLLRLAWPDNPYHPGRSVALSDYFPLEKWRQPAEEDGLSWPVGLNDDDRHVLAELRTLLAGLAELVGRLSPVEILERLVEERRLIPLAGGESDGQSRIWAITAFLAQSRALGRNRSQPLGPAEELKAIRDNWDDRYDGRKSGGGDDEAVTLTTVHGAKGLEYPIVVIAEADYRPRPNSDPAVISADGALALRFIGAGGEAVQTAAYMEILKETRKAETDEYGRLMYVAVTRARDHLVFLGWPKEAGSTENDLEAPSLADTAPVWLEALNQCPAAENLSVTVEYDPADLIRPAAVPPAEADDPAETGKPILLQPMRLSGQALSVTALGHMLADPDNYFHKHYLGLDRDFDYRPNQDFFDLNPGSKPEAVRTLAATDAGTLFHAVMERIDPRTPEPECLIRSQADRLNLEPGPEEMIDLAAKVGVFLACPIGLAWQAALDAGRPEFRELPFWLEVPGPTAADHLSLTGIIDLFFLDVEGIGHIVDYKLAAFHEGPELTGYENQLTIYAQALRVNGFSGRLTARLYFAGGEKPMIHNVIFNESQPMTDLLERLKNNWKNLSDTRPLRPNRPGPLNTAFS